MNLYRLSQSTVRGYDTYDSCVVAAESEDAARRIHPSDYRCNAAPDADCFLERSGTWCYMVDDVNVELIGTAVDGTECGVICASFNAG
jgi:hypothetical protein